MISINSTGQTAYFVFITRRDLGFVSISFEDYVIYKLSIRNDQYSPGGPLVIMVNGSIASETITHTYISYQLCHYIHYLKSTFETGVFCFRDVENSKTSSKRKCLTEKQKSRYFFTK